MENASYEILVRKILFLYAGLLIEYPSQAFAKFQFFLGVKKMAN